MKHILVCNHCEAFLSKAIEVDEAPRRYNDFSGLEWENAAKPGQAIVILDVTTEYINGKKTDEIKELNYWLNTQDVSENTWLDTGLAIGCCGPSGKINTRCVCQSLIGRTFADCIGPHYFSPEKHKTKLIEYIEDAVLREQDKTNRLYRNARVQKKRNSRHRKTT